MGCNNVKSEVHKFWDRKGSSSEEDALFWQTVAHKAQATQLACEEGRKLQHLALYTFGGVFVVWATYSLRQSKNGQATLIRGVYELTAKWTEPSHSLDKVSKGLTFAGIAFASIAFLLLDVPTPSRNFRQQELRYQELAELANSQLLYWDEPGLVYGKDKLCTWAPISKTEYIQRKAEVDATFGLHVPALLHQWGSHQAMRKYVDKYLDKKESLKEDFRFSCFPHFIFFYYLKQAHFAHEVEKLKKQALRVAKNERTRLFCEFKKKIETHHCCCILTGLCIQHQDCNRI